MRQHRAPDTPEFEARQQCFDFGIVARAVLAIVVKTKKTLTTWWKKERPTKAERFEILMSQYILRFNSAA